MKFFTISRLFLFSMLIGGVLIFSIVYAAVNNNQLFPNGVSGYVQSKDNGWVTPASTSKDITIWDGSCRRISSTSNTLAFIPTRTQAEWGSFSAHLPSGVSVGSCGVNGLCNNTTNFACSSGTSVNNISGSCGGNATWQCQ
jgi:hypothetical protein